MSHLSSIYRLEDVKGKFDNASPAKQATPTSPFFPATAVHLQESFSVKSSVDEVRKEKINTNASCDTVTCPTLLQAPKGNVSLTKSAHSPRETKKYRSTPSVYRTQYVYIAQFKSSPIEFSATDDYQVQKQIGQGSYGIVVKAVHLPTSERVVIKQIVFPPHCKMHTPHLLSDYDLIASRTLREIRILRFLQARTTAENITLDQFVVLRDILQLRSTQISCINLSMKLMASDLRTVLRNPTQGLTDEHIQYMMYNLLRAVNYLHSAGIAHRDIKPENILVSEICDTVLCDFGLAREVTNEDMTLYVETRWYRAPELIMEIHSYDEKVDLWSLGCIMAEMMMKADQRTPLWKGSNVKEQFDQILTTLGIPAGSRFRDICSKSTRNYLEKMREKGSIPDESQIHKRLPPNSNPLALNLVNQLLAISPEDRPSAIDCLTHPFFAQIRDAKNEPRCGIKYKDEELELLCGPTLNPSERTQRLRERLYDEMLDFHPELRDLKLVDDGSLASLSDAVVEH